ncbi:MAG: hypothetical protein AB8I08_17430 [Sandaracinaceae bacterium]
MPEFHEVAIRYSFPGLTASLMDTGRAMASFAELAVEALAPELSWAHAVREHADYGALERWEATHVVAFEGRSPGGELLGRAESRLVAGGQGSRIGGSARIVVESVRPTRVYRIETPCDVTHWDLVGGPVQPSELDAVRRLLETTLERGSEATVIRKTALVREPQRLSGAAEDLAVWAKDLARVGIETERDGEGLRMLRGTFDDLDALQAARVTLGEIAAESGKEDWDDAALGHLLRLPHA